jgi:hypothetical protein
MAVDPALLVNRRIQQPPNRLEKKMLVVSFWVTTVGDPTKLDTTCLSINSSSKTKALQQLLLASCILPVSAI